MGIQGRNFAEKEFSIISVVKAHLNIYYELILRKRL